MLAGLYGFYVYVNGLCEILFKDGKIVLGGVVGGYYDL